MPDDLRYWHSRRFFRADHLAGILVIGVLVTPYVYGVIWLEIMPESKHRYSISASIIIALV